METSISALAYKGSIAEAILEAKRLKKLFLVYISGDSSESAELEKTTWTDSRVVESLSKYCVLLHLRDGSTDAANFSVIYPQKSAPSIAAIGYNGVQVWQSEGFVSPEALVSNLEKAWFSLHIQDTTASFLTAALASNKPDSSVSLSGQETGDSSNSVAPLTCMDEHGQSSKGVNDADSEVIEKYNCEEQTVEERKINLEESLSGPTNVNKSDDFEVSQSMSPVEEVSELLPPLVNSENSRIDSATSDGKNNSSAVEEVVDYSKGCTGGNSQTVKNEEKEDIVVKNTERDHADMLDNSVRSNTSSDVLLNIKLPNGVSLQEKFSLLSTLRAVKEYVNRNQASGFNSYDLAIPYPRRIFSDQDLSKLLSELGLSNRQALIVVPRQRAGIHDRGGSFFDRASNTANNDSSSASNEGYFASIRKILSYFNPFSYLPGTSSASSERAQTGMWEYGPNPQALQSNISRADGPYNSSSSSPSSSSVGRNERKSSKPTTTHFGGNIHTLKHDEDDGRFGDQNRFWNGNSTQYGGNSDGK